jgi:acetyltransferase-like isoleucine patch superfamily enzyme
MHSSILLLRTLLPPFVSRTLATVRTFFNTKKRITGINNVINSRATCSGPLDIIISGDYNLVDIGVARVEGLSITISASNSVLRICDDVQLLRGGCSICIEDSNSSVHIGRSSALYADVHIASTEGARIHIGSNCLIAPGVTIRNGDSHSIFCDGIRCNHAQDVFVDNFVWICEGALLLKGAAVAEGSIVAAKSVLTKPFNVRGALLAGNPARLLRTGLNWALER